jgi:hypothetical protein
MANKALTESIFDAGLRRVNFFNGRLLSGEDLSHEQVANETLNRRLGSVIGGGVAYGLEVRATSGVDRVRQPALSVTPGLALTPRGDALLLTKAVDLPLTDVSDTSSSAAADITTFSVCQEPLGTEYVAGAVLYVLTIGAVEGREGRAPVSGLGNIDLSCNTKYLVSGVRFRLIPIQMKDMDERRLRNRVAYRCYAQSRDADFWTAPFGPSPVEGGLIDGLRSGRLQPCETPLAVVYRTASKGLVFVDMWAARRRVTPPPADSGWPLLASASRQTERAALFLQFRDQLDDLRLDAAAPNTVRATDHFRFVPPVGVVPLASSSWRAGFEPNTFFDGVTTAPAVVIEAGRLAFLLSMSYDFPPVDLDSGVVLRLFHVRENQQEVDSDTAISPQPYLVFASGHIPPLGDAHFDVNHWSYSNFARE